MNHKQSFWAYYIGVLGGCFIMVIGCALDMNWIVFGIGLVLMFMAHVLVGLFYKCPHCNTYLNIRARRPKHCPECGRKIEW